MEQGRSIDLDTPAGAREYVQIAQQSLLPPGTDRVRMASGEWIHFNNMTDEQAVRVARGIYFGIEEEVARKAVKQ